MLNDYRRTEYCNELSNVEAKKKMLEHEILRNHPRTKVFYNKVRDNDNIYKSKFMAIYNFKCSYCGNSIENLSKVLFEIDHYICENYFETSEDAGRMENLVLACYDCNRSKGKMIIDEKYYDTLHPDYGKIMEVFIRDEYYYIRISKQYKDDQFITMFYNQLKLGYQVRRLDFLLMNLRGLCKKIEGKPQAKDLNIILRRLLEKRNLATYTDLSREQVLA